MKKINQIVDDLLNEFPSGESFFNNFDEIIRLPKNIDIVKNLFDQIYKENNTFNIVVSGKFGDWISYLVKKGELKIPGNFLMVSGSLRGRKTFQMNTKIGKDVEVLWFKKDYNNQDFIFIDDSYYSGSTKKAIERFLKKHNSRIIKTYVIYDGNEKRDENIKSSYRYYDHKKEKIIPVQKLYDIVDKIKNDIQFDINYLYNKISSGEIRTPIELFKLIKTISDKFGYHIDIEKLYNLTYRYNEKKTFIMKFNKFLNS
jgi:hypoxanthine-guanine phosphoribosyltransferase